MKLTIRSIGSATFLGVMLATPLATLVAQSAVESTTTTTTIQSAGTISEFNPETIVIKSETSTEPVSYAYSKTTTYVDETGAPVSMAIVKSGLPVTVFYTKDGDKMVASKVIVRKAATEAVAVPMVDPKKTTTTKTTTKTTTDKK